MQTLFPNKKFLCYNQRRKDAYETGFFFANKTNLWLDITRKTFSHSLHCKGETMSKEVVVESFELDHTIVKAPYVRLIGEETGPKGDIISNFDIRLVQPNEDSIPTAGLHTIEHLLAMLIRKRIDGMIDCSPFGCRTGFHMIMWGQHSSSQIAQVIKSCLEEIAESTSWEDVPGTTIESCGNYKDHSLFSAKEWAKLILSQGISDDAFERHVI
ncbi:S-ribosylhomocysteine lyase, putative [Streptococcus sanguinis SK36]|nr:S-ribosylhomocysteine lyase, putative [Streptococcus sanguinis SK36]